MRSAGDKKRLLDYRLKFQLAFYQSTIGQIWVVFVFLLAITAMALFVVWTYVEVPFLTYVRYAFAVVFLVDTALYFFMLNINQKFLFFLDRFMVTNLIVILATATTTRYNLDFFLVARCVHFWDTMDLLPFLRGLQWLRSTIRFQVIRLALVALSLAFIFAGLFYVVESQFQHLTYVQALYFVIVSMGTVGYGDITPASNAGRFVVIVLITVSVIIVPYEASTLIGIMINRNRMVAYQRKFDELLGPHIVVAGFITAATIKMFLREYFHEVIAMRMNRTVVVIVGRDNPDAAIVEILNEPNLRHFLQFIKGDLVLEADAIKARLSHAIACFIMVDTSAQGKRADESDRRTALLAIAVRKFHATVPVYTMMHHMVLRDQLLTNDITVVPTIDQLKMTFLAYNCIAPGFSTMIIQLVRSRTEPLPPDALQWQKEVYHGNTKEIVSVRLRGSYVNMEFLKAVEAVYDDCSALLFGCLHEDASGFNDILLNPGGGYVIKGTELFFVIGSYSDLEDARTEVIVDYDSPGAAPLPIFSHVPEGWHRRDARIRAGISKLKNETQKSEAELFEVGASSEVINLWSPIELPESVKSTSLYISEKGRLMEKLRVWTLPAEVREHIIIVGGHKGVGYLVETFRRSEIHQSQPIVIFFKKLPSRFWRHENDLQNTYLVVGSPLEPYDWHRAGLDRCKHICFLNSEESDDGTEEDLMAILSILSIEKEKKASARPTTLASENSLKFFEANSSFRESVTYLNSLAFASGILHLLVRCQVLSAEQMEPFLVQAYFKPYLIKIVRKMVRWTDTHPDLLKRQSWLSSNHIPDQFVNRPFSVLIYAMMAAGALPVALYRSGKTTGSTLPYVFLTPPATTLVGERDHVIYFENRDVDAEKWNTFDVKAYVGDLMVRMRPTRSRSE